MGKRKLAQVAYEDLCKLSSSSSSSSLTEESFLVQNPFMQRLPRSPTAGRLQAFNVFQPGQISVDVLHMVLASVIVPSLAAAQMTWEFTTQKLARPLVIAVFQALRSICLNLPARSPGATSGGPEATAAAARQAAGQAWAPTAAGVSTAGNASAASDMTAARASGLGSRPTATGASTAGGPSAAAAAAAADNAKYADDDDDGMGVAFTLSSPPQDESGAVPEDAQEGADVGADADERRRSETSDGSLTAAHEASNSFLNSQAADFACYKTYKGRKVVKLVVEAKESLFAKGQEEWMGSGRFQLLQYTARAAMHNFMGPTSFAGEVFGLGTDLARFGLCKVEVSGVMVVDDQGRCQFISSDGTAGSEDEIQQMYTSALMRVRQVKGCETLEKLLADQYLVGSYAVTKVESFLPYPLVKLHPSPVSPLTARVNRMSVCGYAALQGLLFICGGKQVTSWTVDDINLRIREWARWVANATKTVYPAVSQDEWLMEKYGKDFIERID